MIISVIGRIATVVESLPGFDSDTKILAGKRVFNHSVQQKIAVFVD